MSGEEVSFVKRESVPMIIDKFYRFFNSTYQTVISSLDICGFVPMCSPKYVGGKVVVLVTGSRDKSQWVIREF